MPQHEKPTLYGITEQNSSRHGSTLWGKNQFNSTFPLALCLYMRDIGIMPVSVLGKEAEIVTVDDFWSFEKVLGSKEQNPYFHFEKTFDHYSKLSRNEVDKIDMVVSIDQCHVTPLEVKLTVVPDSTTAKNDEGEWAPEMVVRPVSSAHAMMGVATSLLRTSNREIREKIIKILKKAYNKISDWNNTTEIEQNAWDLVGALSLALKSSTELQKPFLIQPIWRTRGQSLALCENCFDVFVWSDVAVMRIPIDQCRQESGITRPLREVARHVRAMYDLLVTEDYDYKGVYKGMSLGNQTDKSFALSGKKTFKYLQHPRLVRPKLPASVLDTLVLNGGDSELKPERRFDAAVVSHMSTNVSHS